MPTGAAVGQIAPEGVKKSLFRPDIQGLRMVAVLAVVADHLFQWPSGGFVGVDVFFVISGFLITGLLLREHERTQTISFVGFYARRIKRIVPAATVVLIVTVIAAWIVFTASRFQSTFTDAVWAFFFASNWHFAAVGTDYFTADAAVSPLQHFWSLSVEEQFYFVWPWLMLLIFIWMGFHRQHRSPRTARRVRRVLAWTMTGIIVASFAWSILETIVAPTWAYFSTFSRAWELGIGALLAVLVPTISRIPDTIRPVLAWVGLVGIGASIFLINEALPFPGPYALAPVAATALVIIAGTGAEARFLWPLTNPVSRWFGDISYSIYLWHFPVIVILATIFPFGPTYIALCISAMMILSVASYYLVENPIRRSRWLEPTGRGPSAETVDRIKYISVGVATVAVAALAYVALQPPETPETAYADQPRATATESPAPALPPITQPDITTALAATAWPARELTKEYLDSLQPESLTSPRCFNNLETIDRSCTFGPDDAEQRIALVGDSVAMTWAPTVRKAYPDAQLLTIGKSACAFNATPITAPDGTPYQSCVDFQGAVAAELAEFAPTLVIISNADHEMTRIVGDARGEERIELWVAGLSESIRVATSLGAKVAVLTSPPTAPPIADCATKLNTPADCAGAIDDQWNRQLTAYQEAVNRAATPDVVLVNAANWFCTTEGVCPAVFEDAPVRVDHFHMTTTYASRIAPNLQEALAPIAG